jgi:hypothetical protein
MADATHLYRWHRVMAGQDRHGQPCRLLATGARMSALVQFADGWRAITSRRALRRLRDRSCSADVAEGCGLMSGSAHPRQLVDVLSGEYPEALSCSLPHIRPALRPPAHRDTGVACCALDQLPGVVHITDGFAAVSGCRKRLRSKQLCQDLFGCDVESAAPDQVREQSHPVSPIHIAVTHHHGGGFTPGVNAADG